MRRIIYFPEKEIYGILNGMTIGLCGGGGKSELHWTLWSLLALLHNFFHLIPPATVGCVVNVVSVEILASIQKQFTNEENYNSYFVPTDTPSQHWTMLECSSEEKFAVRCPLDRAKNTQKRESDKINKRQRCGEVKRKKRKTIINYFLWTTNKQTEERKKKNPTT